MKSLAFPLALLFVCACGMAPGKQDPTFSGYVKEYEKLYSMDVSNLNIQFGKLGPDTVGECDLYRSTITISTDYWPTLTDLGREETLFHELGHCAMGLGHDNNMVTDPLTGNPIPESIMYYQVIGNQEYYGRLHTYYVNQLWTLYRNHDAGNVFMDSAFMMDETAPGGLRL